MNDTVIEVNEANVWRLETPGATGWTRSARPGAANKYLMISADSHANEPTTLWRDRIDKKFVHRLTRMWVDEKGNHWRQSEGENLPSRIITSNLSGEDLARSRAGADPLDRLKDHDLDGIDGELIFPNKGIQGYWTRDPEFSEAQLRVYNDWAWETYSPHIERLSPVACIVTAEVSRAMAEIERVAKLGFRCLMLPTKPLYGAHGDNELNYNKPEFDPMWALIESTGLPITFHVSTGKDPRTARGMGGAVTNYVCHSLSPTIEPIAHICSAGVAERFPKLRFGTVEAGIGWLPWFLDAMDEAYRKHYFWVRPKLAGLPSDYFRAQGFGTFQEDQSGLDLIEKHGLVNNVMWANDYPHHEGTWPHSAEAIERTMGTLQDESRAKVLGGNAARVFGFKTLVESANAQR